MATGSLARNSAGTTGEVSLVGAGFVPARVGHRHPVLANNTGDHKGRPYDAVAQRHEP